MVPADVRVALVTGASSGIGAELSRQLGAAGVQVGMIALPEPALEAEAEAIRSRGGVVLAVGADVTDRSALADAIRRIEAELGPIDLVIASAGIGLVTDADKFSIENLDRQVQVNLIGVANTFEPVIPGMIERGHGYLAGISSLSSYRGIPWFWGYCAAKSALAIMLEGMRVELRSRGISVTTVRPGYVRTPMTASNPSPMFMVEVDWAARTILKGVARRRAEVAFPWQATLTTRLIRWLPNWLFDRICDRVIRRARAGAVPS